MEYRIILTISIFCLFSGGAANFAWAEKPSLREKIKQERSNLKQLKQEIQEAKKQQEATQKRHDSVLASVESLDRKVHQKRKDYDAIRHEIGKTDRELEKINQKANQLKVSLQRREQAVKTRLRRLYMEGQSGWFQSLLSFHSYAQFQRRMTYLSSLTSWEQNVVAHYKDDMKQFLKLKEDRARIRSVLLRNKERTAKKLNVMRGIKGNKQAILTSLKHQTLTHGQALATLERAEERKEFLLDNLLQSSKKYDPESKKRVVSFLKKGKLLWPVDGRVVAFYGRQKHPMFNTYVNKKGIEIETREGSEIKAVFGGNVVFADWLKGYGLVAILDHRNGFFSFYAHASKLVVQRDDDVASGEVIGHTGASGLTDKTILYFELRKGTQPVDPQKWLVRR